MAATRLRIFISSVQKEFGEVRTNLKTFLLGDAVLRRFISEVFLFEELPASDRGTGEIYLHEVDRCDIYLGIFGYDYGFEDEEGVSPTEREFARATLKRKERLIYVWGSDEDRRAPKMKGLIRKASDVLIRRRVIEDPSALTAEVYASLVDYLDRRGALRIPPFDAAAAELSLDEISRKRVSWFLETASRERAFPLTARTTTKALLTHLNLLSDGKPTNAAALLFGSAPQRLHRSSDVKCSHAWHFLSAAVPFLSDLRRRSLRPCRSGTGVCSHADQPHCWNARRIRGRTGGLGTAGGCRRRGDHQRHRAS